MTKEELKRYLHNYQDIKEELAQVSERLTEVEAKMSGPRGAASDGLPRGTGGADPMFGIVSQHIALQEKYASMQEKLAECQLGIEELIESLDSRERRLMRHYYIEGMTWEKVCVAMNYSWRQVHNIHSDALNRLMEVHGGKSA